MMDNSFFYCIARRQGITLGRSGLADGWMGRMMMLGSPASKQLNAHIYLELRCTIILLISIVCDLRFPPRLDTWNRKQRTLFIYLASLGRHHSADDIAVGSYGAYTWGS